MAGAAARSPRILTSALGALVLLLAALAFWVGAQARDEQALADDSQAALVAAGTHAVDLLSLSHKTADTDIQRILATSTGQARADYSVNAARLKDTTVANKVVQTGVLRATGLVSIEGGDASVLVVADGEIRWDGEKETPGQSRFYRWSMGVTKVGGVWLVSKVEQVT